MPEGSPFESLAYGLASRGRPKDQPQEFSDQRALEALVMLKKGYMPLTAVAALYENKTYQDELVSLLGHEGGSPSLLLTDVLRDIQDYSNFSNEKKSHIHAFLQDIYSSGRTTDLSAVVARQAGFEQQIVELVANGMANPVGKFGIGAMSAFPRGPKDVLTIQSSTGLSVEIIQKKGEYYFRYLKKEENLQQGGTRVLGKIKDFLKKKFRYLEKEENLQQGTRVSVTIKDFLTHKDDFILELRKRFSMSRQPIQIIVDEESGKREEIIGESSSPQQPVKVTITDSGYIVEDHNGGLSEKTFLEKYIQPMASGTRRQLLETQDSKPQLQIETRDLKEGEQRALYFQSGDITIFRVSLPQGPGADDPRYNKHIVVYVPQEAIRDVSRTTIAVNDELIRALEQAQIQASDEQTIISLGYLNGYLLSQVRVDTDWYTRLKANLSHLAEKLPKGKQYIPDVPEGRVLARIAGNAQVVPLELFAMEGVQKPGTLFRNEGGWEFQSPKYVVRLVDFDGKKGVLTVGNTVFLDKTLFNKLTAQGEEGQALLNLLIHPTDTGYSSAALLKGKKRFFIGRFVKEEKKIMPPSIHHGPKGETQPQSGTEARGAQIRNQAKTRKGKEIFNKIIEQESLVFGDDNLCYFLRHCTNDEVSQIDLFLDKVLPQDGNFPDEWDYPISALFRNFNLSSILESQKYPLSRLLDRILPQDGKILDGWNYPISALFRNFNLSSILESQKYPLSRLLDRILPQDGKVLDGWYYPIFALFENPHLSSILKSQNISLSDLLDRILPQDGKVLDGWYYPISALFESPHLFSILKSQNISLSDLLDRILPQDGKVLNGWHYSISGLFENPNLKENINALAETDLFFRLVKHDFQIRSDSLPIIVDHLRRTAPIRHQAALLPTIAPDLDTWNIPLSGIEEVNSQLQKVLQLRAQENNQNEVSKDTLRRLYRFGVDRVEQELPNTMQKLYALELLDYYGKDDEQTIAAVIAFAKTQYAQQVVTELLTMKDCSFFTRQILDLLPDTSFTPIEELRLNNNQLPNDSSISVVRLMANRSRFLTEDSEPSLDRLLTLCSFDPAAEGKDSLFTALTGQTPRPDTWVRELLQNGVGEALHTKTNKIRIKTGMDSEGRACFEITDLGRGMDMKDIVTKLLQPLAPDRVKREHDVFEGGIGWGFFTVFPQAEAVDLKTTKNGATIVIRLEPYRNEKGAIEDIRITYVEQVANSALPNGTQVLVHTKSASGLPQLDMITIKAALELYLDPIVQHRKDLAIVVDGEEKKPYETETVGRLPWNNAAGMLAISLTSKDGDPFGRVCKKGFYLHDTHDPSSQLLAFVPDSILAFYAQNGYRIQISLPEHLYANLSRVGLAITQKERRQLQTQILHLFLQDVARRVATGQGQFSVIPDDMLTNNPEYYGLFAAQHHQDVLRKIISGEELTDADYAIIQNPNALSYILQDIPFPVDQEYLKGSVDPFFQSLPKGSYTWREIRKLLDAQSSSDSPLSKERTRILSGIQKTDEARRAHTAWIDTGRDENQPLESLVDLMQSYVSLIGEDKMRLHMALADPDTIRSTAWGRKDNDTLLGMPFSREFLEKWKANQGKDFTQEHWWYFYDILAHEMTHYVEGCIFEGNVGEIQWLLQYMIGTKEVVSPQQARDAVGAKDTKSWTHTRDEQFGFAKIYKAILEMIASSLEENCLDRR